MAVSVLEHPQLHPSRAALPLSQFPTYETLADVIERHGPLPPDVAVECLAKIAEDLRANAWSGLSPERVSAAQVLVDDEGAVTLIPEENRGRKGVPSQNLLSDLGKLLRYLLTGREAERTGVVARYFRGARPSASLRGTLPNVPEELDAIYRRLTAPRSGEQFAGLEHLLAALTACANKLGRSRAG